MFGAYVLVVEALALLIGELHHLTSPIRKAFIHSSHLRQAPAKFGPAPRHRAKAEEPRLIRSYPILALPTRIVRSRQPGESTIMEGYHMGSILYPTIKVKVSVVIDANGSILYYIKLPFH